VVAARVAYDMRSIKKASGLVDVGRSAVGSTQISWISSVPLARCHRVVID